MVLALTRHQDMGRKGGSAPKHRWTEEERDIIRREYAQTHESKRRIAAKLSLMTGERITANGVAGQIQRMGIAKSTSRRPWTPEEDETLRELIHRFATITIAKRMKRSLNAVEVRAKRLGIKRRYRDGWYTKREVAEILGVDHKKVRAWMDAGKIKASYHHGHKPQKNGSGAWHFAEKDLASFIRCYPDELNGRNVDLIAIVDILTGGLMPPPLSGRDAAGGIDG